MEIMQPIYGPTPADVAAVLRLYLERFKAVAPGKAGDPGRYDAARRALETGKPATDADVAKYNAMHG